MSDNQSAKRPHIIGPVLVLLGLAGAGWYWWKPVPAPVEVPVAVTEPAATVAETKTPDPDDVLTNGSEPADPISEQAADAGVDPTLLDGEQTVAEQPALPALDESDALVKQELLALNWKAGLAALFVDEEMIRRFVVQVDNIAQGQIVPEQTIFKGLSKDFQAKKQGQQYQLDTANYSRYLPYLELLESAPKAQVVALFNKLYPLMQAAYQELGYPDKQFRDRLQQAIAVLVAAPEIADGPLLVLDSVQYDFADNEVEQLPLAHKQMIRLGQKNQQRLKLLLSAYQPLLAK
jgi:hypothetical protein